MKISIITPTFNSDKIIARNINSILSQSYNNYEHIIIDNLSSDNTILTIKDLFENSGKTKQLNIISEKDNGIAEAFNKGIKESNGEIIGILNSDDYYYDETVLEKIADAFREKNILYLHGNIYFHDPIYGSNVRKPLMCSITQALPFNHPTMFFRKEVYKEYGGFDTGYNYAMDFEIICRLIKQVDDFYNKGIYLKGEPLVTMAAGGASWENELDSIEETRKALKKYGFWNFDAKKFYAVRVLRTKLKKLFNRLNANTVVKLWRKIKWRT